MGLIWLVEAGIPKSRIYSSQGFIAPVATSFPFALRIESPSKNYDTGGMSVEGAIPRNGHLGAIVYGQSAVNNIRVEGDANLFATFHQMDPGWAVGEFNTADFRTPKELPSYAMTAWSLAACYAQMGRLDEARAFAARQGILPGGQWLKIGSLYGDPQQRELLLSGLRLATATLQSLMPTCRWVRACGRSVRRATPTPMAGPR